MVDSTINLPLSLLMTASMDYSVDSMYKGTLTIGFTQPIVSQEKVSSTCK